MYDDCDKIIALLAAPDLSSINLNLKRIMQDLHRKIFDRIAKIIYQVGMTKVKKICLDWAKFWRWPFDTTLNVWNPNLSKFEQVSGFENQTKSLDFK